MRACTIRHHNALHIAAFPISPCSFVLLGAVLGSVIWLTCMNPLLRGCYAQWYAPACVIVSEVCLGPLGVARCCGGADWLLGCAPQHDARRVLTSRGVNNVQSSHPCTATPSRTRTCTSSLHPSLLLHLALTTRWAVYGVLVWNCALCIVRALPCHALRKKCCCAMSTQPALMWQTDLRAALCRVRVRMVFECTMLT
jgi:hypothetical protein